MCTQFVRCGTHVGRLSASLYRVLDVVGVVPGSQMVWVDADASITGVQNKRLLRSERVMQVVNKMRSPVGQDCLPVGHHQPPVPRINMDAARPVPASISRRVTRHVRSEDFGHCSLGPTANHRVTVLEQASVMRIAKATSFDGLFAVGNGASSCSGDSAHLTMLTPLGV